MQIQIQIRIQIQIQMQMQKQMEMPISVSNLILTRTKTQIKRSYHVAFCHFWSFLFWRQTQIRIQGLLQMQIQTFLYAGVWTQQTWYQIKCTSKFE